MLQRRRSMGSSHLGATASTSGALDMEAEVIGMNGERYD